MSTPPDRAAVLQVWERLQRLQRVQRKVELLRTCFASAAGEQRPLSVAEVLQLLRAGAGHCRETDKQRQNLEKNIAQLEAWAAKQDSPPSHWSVRDLPPDVLAAATVHMLSACDGVITETVQKVRAEDAEVRKMLGILGLSAEQLLAEEIESLRKDGGAHAIVLCGQPIGALRPRLVDLLQSQSAVQTVVLRGCHLNDADAAALLPVLKGLQHLRLLCMAGNGLGADTEAALRKALSAERDAAFPTLQLLDVSHNGIEAAAADELQRIVADRQLKRTLKQDLWVHSVSEQRVRVLSIDGGGARMLGQIECLKRLEAVTGRPINDTFHCIVGSGTGALVACAVRFGISLERIADFARDLAALCTRQDWTLLWLAEAAYRGTRSWFTSGDWYSGSALRQLLLELFGAERRICDSPKPLAVVLANPTAKREHVLRSYGTTSVLPHGEGSSKVSVLDALRAALALPGCFSPWQVGGQTLCDAGMLHENPSLLAVTELTRSVDPQKLVLLSVGSGVDLTLGDGAYEDTSRHSLIARKLAAQHQQAPAAAAETHGHVQSMSEVSGLRYYRLNPCACRPMQLDVGAVQWDESNPIVLQSVGEAVTDWLGQETARVDKIRQALQ